MKGRDSTKEREDTGDRNGREFVMSGVEMTVPFVLKFVGFSRRGIVT